MTRPGDLHARKLSLRRTGVQLLGGAVLLVLVGFVSSVWSPLEGVRGLLLVAAPLALAAAGATCIWRSLGR